MSEGVASRGTGTQSQSRESEFLFSWAREGDDSHTSPRAVWRKGEEPALPATAEIVSYTSHRDTRGGREERASFSGSRAYRKCPPKVAKFLFQCTPQPVTKGLQLELSRHTLFVYDT